MTIFVDTSAIYALVDRSDNHHEAASVELRRLLSEESDLMTHNYVLVEAAALLQNRLGFAAVRVLLEEVAPLLRAEWIGAHLHSVAVDSLLNEGRRKLSLVDCASFAVMRELSLETAFCFDSDFRDAGFLTVP